MFKIEAGFIWNGIHSNDKGFKITSLPNITTPEKRVEKVVIPNRDGYFTIDEGTYEGEVKTVEFDYFGNQFDDIKTWLNGSGLVVFSNEPDKYYRATIINKIDLKRILEKFNSCIVQFDCQPYGYLRNNISVYNNFFNSIERNSTVINPLASLNYVGGHTFQPNKPIIINQDDSKIEFNNFGNIESKPVITVWGTGTITLNINDELISITNISGHVVIDSEIMECYKENILFNNYMTGDFPVLKTGLNKITWSGNLEKIEVKPNWRCL